MTVKRLLDFLTSHEHTSKDKAINRVQLASWLNVTPRDLRALCEEARLQGHFVSYSTDAESGGIYVATSDEEREDILRRLRGTCLNRLRQYNAMKREHLRAPEQQTLFG